MDPAELSRCLGRNERAARRFRIEARALTERLEDDLALAEPEEVSTPETQAGEAGGDEGAPLAQADVQRVLHAWRELDLALPPDDPEEFVLPRPPEPTAERALSDLAPEGFSRAMLERLGESGVTTWRDFVEAPAVDLACTTGLSYSRIKRLQFLARRGGETGVSSRSAPPSEGPRDPPRGDRLEAAGPFA